MRNLILVLGFLMTVSCSVDEVNDVDVLVDDIESIIDYNHLILGDWDDLSDDDEDASFDGEKVVFTSGDVSFEYEYWIDGDEITIKYGEYTIITNALIIDGDLMKIGEREYERK